MDMCSGPKVAAARRPTRRYLSPTCETRARSELFGHSPRPFRAFGLARNLSGSLTDVMRDVRVHELLDAHDRCHDEEAESDEQEKGLLERESTARGARRRRREIIARARRVTVSEVQGYRRRVARGGGVCVAHAVVSFSSLLRFSSSRAIEKRGSHDDPAQRL